jgi:hypothetical protein
VLLPRAGTEGIYKLFERYQALSLHDKLTVYPILSTNFLKEISRSLQQIIMRGWPPYLKFMAAARHNSSKHVGHSFNSYTWPTAWRWVDVQ